MPDSELSKKIAFAGRADEIREQLFQYELPVYVFVDPILVDPFKGAKWRDKTPVYRVDLKRYGLSQDEMPYFFQLSSPLDPKLEESLQLAEYQLDKEERAKAMCGWFVSALPPSAIQQGLLHSIQYPIGQGRLWLFRFFDPRTTRHIKRIFGSDWQLAGLKRWWYLHTTELASVAGNNQLQVPQPPSQTQREAIDRVMLVNKAFTQWKDMQQPLPDDAFQLLDQALLTGRRAGISTRRDEDSVAFALHRCLIHSRIEKHPLVKQWIEKSQEEHSSYVSCAAVASKDTWDEIAAGDWEKDKEIGYA